MARFLTADLHLGHARICEYTGRPFDSVEEMNDWIIDAWNELVTDTDEVYVLGDVALGKISETLPLAAELRGRRHLVIGNHDRPFEPGPRRPEWQHRYREVGFETIVHGSIELDLGLGEPVLACHFPYEGDSLGEERFEALRPADHGKRLAHGHMHGQYRRRGRMMDVGVDAWGGRPVTFEQVAEAFRSDEERLPPLPWTR